MVLTDVNVKEDDERINSAFSYATQHLLIKAEKNTVEPATAEQQVKLEFCCL